MKIIINLLITIIMFFILEIICINIYRLEINQYIPKKISFKNMLKKEYQDFRNLINEEYYNPETDWRERRQNKSSKRAVTAGCSFTHGAGLEDDETFASRLSEYTGYDVINIGISGASPRETLYILRNMPKHNTNADYVFYTYIQDQKPRMYAKLYRNSPAFIKIKENNIETLQYSKIKSFYENISRINFFIKRYIAYHIDEYKSFELFCLYMKEINKEIKKKFSDKTELIVIFYQDYDNDFEKDAAKKLEEDGIKIIRLSDILPVDINTNEYRLTEIDDHPNSKAWQIIVPVLAEYLNLNKIEN